MVYDKKILQVILSFVLASMVASQCTCTTGSYSNNPYDGFSFNYGSGYCFSDGVYP